VLELIHAAVGIAIHLHLNNNIPLNEVAIYNGNNSILKVWFLYYRLAGYWKAHRAGIRSGNVDMQLKNLAAFAPLFPATGKNIYALSVVTFLESVSRHPQQRELLKHVASVNITRENHYLAFDEALEQYGVKFVKQNLTSSLSDPVILKQRITAIQDERERMMMLFNEFVGAWLVQKIERLNNTQKLYGSLLTNLPTRLITPIPHSTIFSSTRKK
jgi:hypothetical protein